MRISDWSSDVCSSDLDRHPTILPDNFQKARDLFRLRLIYGLERRVADGTLPNRSENHIRQEDVGGEIRRSVDLRRHVEPRQVLSRQAIIPDRKSVVWGKIGSVIVDSDGRRIIKKKTQEKN